MRTETAPSWPVTIFIAGSLADALCVCGDYCDEVGLCVTVTSTTYVYTDGAEEGVIVGLINYPRFPSDRRQIEERADALGWHLLEGLGQESFTVQTPETTRWFSMRLADLAIAAAARQSGGKAASPTPSPHHPKAPPHE